MRPSKASRSDSLWLGPFRLRRIRIPSRVLLVEGQDDEHVVSRLLERHQSVLSFSILNKQTISRLLPAISIEIKASGRQAVGILVDADDNMAARWDAVRGQLSKADISPPPSPDPAGTIIDGTPRIGIWLMPNNESPGELEDFVVRMIPDGDKVWPLSRRYIEDIPEAERKFSEKKKLRAKLYAWLAAREDPRQTGLAIRAGDLEVDGDLSQKFIDWLTKLFG